MLGFEFESPIRSRPVDVWEHIDIAYLYSYMNRWMWMARRVVTANRVVTAKYVKWLCEPTCQNTMHTQKKTRDGHHPYVYPNVKPLSFPARVDFGGVRVAFGITWLESLGTFLSWQAASWFMCCCAHEFRSTGWNDMPGDVHTQAFAMMSVPSWDTSELHVS